MTSTVFYKKNIMFLWVLAAFATLVFGQTEPNLTQKSESMTSEEWLAIVKSSETEISKGQASAATLHNAALARFKLHQPGQAVAAWLAAWEKNPRDLEIRAGLFGALEQLGIGQGGVNLASHGPWLEWIASSGSQIFPYALICAFVLLIFCVFWTAVSWTALAKHLPQSLYAYRVQSSWFLVGLTTTAWAAVYIWYASLGLWGAVIVKEGAVLRKTPAAESLELGRLMEGTPVYIVGDSYAPWLRVLDANGNDGYVNALEVRVIRGTRQHQNTTGYH